MNSLKEKARYWLQGNINYWLYYSKRFGWLLSKHIREQIEYRMGGLDMACIEHDACLMDNCGCQLSKVIMSNKNTCTSCKFYKFKNSRDWELYKNQNSLIVNSRICVGKQLL